MVGIAQLVRAPDCGSGCRGFESLYPPHMKAEGPGLLFRPKVFPQRQGCSQVVRQGTLTPSLAGSSPAIPAKPPCAVSFICAVLFDPLAQPVEQLPFKPWVRGSNPRRVTTSEQAAYRLLRLFSKVRARSLRCSSFPNRTRFAGLRFGFGRNLERKSILTPYSKKESRRRRLCFLVLWLGGWTRTGGSIYRPLAALSVRAG